MNKITLRNKIIKAYSIHQYKFSLLTNLIVSLKDYSLYKSPFTIINAFTSTAQTILEKSIKFQENFLTESNGWKPVVLENFYNEFLGIFGNVINKFDFYNISFAHDIQLKIFNINGTELAIAAGVENVYIPINANQDELINFLMEKKIEELKTSSFCLKKSTVKPENRLSYAAEHLGLFAESLVNSPSEYSNFYADYIKKCQDKNIKRSLLFYGPPGTGKTTICSTIINNLNLRSLSLKHSDISNIEFIKFFIKTFGIEALLIEDLDHIENSSLFLDLLEWAGKNVKILLATSNSLTKFHPALIRPGRFDEIVLIEKLDPETIKKLMGDLYEEYGEKMSLWPVAYIKEFVNRYNINGKDNIEASLSDLQERVDRQLDMIKED